MVSELLQNADDAGATDASVEISNGEFIFSHNGEDFNEEQFASLCRFGFSNKRTLHTIGFRGVGFKSTFSLGDEVHLVTPTLSVAFEKQRFTEPVWTESSGTVDGRTEVRVVIQNQRVQQELVKNLKEWSESPASLLFFNNIRCLRFDEGEIRWESQGSGPVEGSEWMSVSNTPGNQYLVVRSPEEEFPEDALNEIKDERMTPDDGTDFSSVQGRNRSGHGRTAFCCPSHRGQDSTPVCLQRSIHPGSGSGRRSKTPHCPPPMGGSCNALANWQQMQCSLG